MESRNPKPIYVDSAGKPYYFGTPKNPFSVKELSIVFTSLDEERQRMRSDYGCSCEFWIPTAQQRRNLAAFAIEKSRSGDL